MAVMSYAHLKPGAVREEVKPAAVEPVPSSGENHPSDIRIWIHPAVMPTARIAKVNYCKGWGPLVRCGTNIRSR